MADDMPIFSYDRYEDIKLIGSGSFGKVFTVKDKYSTGIYAMKAINIRSFIQLDHDHSVWESALNECKLMSGLFHANILQLFEYGRSPRSMFDGDEFRLLLEYCPGGDLNAGLQQSSSQELNNRWMKQVVDGVAYLHLKKIVHRDLKPGNVLLTSSGDIKIADFGLSRNFPTEMTNEKEKSYLAPEVSNREKYSRGISNYRDRHKHQYVMRTRAGTPCYAAPEVFDQTRPGYTEKADVFALGLLLYSIEERTFLIVNGKRFYGVFVYNNEPNGSYTSLSERMTDWGQDVLPQFKSSNISLVNTILSCLRYDYGMRPDATKLKDELNNILGA